MTQKSEFALRPKIVFNAINSENFEILSLSVNFWAIFTLEIYAFTIFSKKIIQITGAQIRVNFLGHRANKHWGLFRKNIGG